MLHRIERGMRAWQPPYETEIRQRVRVLGKKAEHVIDFVSFPRTGAPRLPVGVKVVRPSDNPLEQARGYGFMAYDLKDTQFELWPRVAVVTRADDWTPNALDLVRKSATSVLAVDTGKEETIEELLPYQLSEVAA